MLISAGVCCELVPISCFVRNGTLYKPATDAVLKVARRFGQVSVARSRWSCMQRAANFSSDNGCSVVLWQMAVFQWHPYEWGMLDHLETEQVDLIKGKHKNVLQVVIPTRTGLNRLRSSAVVWRRD